jgi:hypothetical protein
VELFGVNALHAALLNESRIRGRVQRSLQKIGGYRPSGLCFHKRLHGGDGLNEIE